LLLDQVLDYFQNYEPSHPAPILIRRSQKMIGMDFATIVEELLPESLASLNQLSGK
jgi:type VI secretion system protein ImpA